MLIVKDGVYKNVTPEKYENHFKGLGYGNIPEPIEVSEEPPTLEAEPPTVKAVAPKRGRKAKK